MSTSDWLTLAPLIICGVLVSPLVVAILVVIVCSLHDAWFGPKRTR